MKGLLLVDKPSGISSFQLIPRLRKISGVKRIGHGGTLDPFATGLVIILIDREYTRLADSFLNHDKAYLTTFLLGQETDTYDLTGSITGQSDLIPSLVNIQEAIESFSGDLQQLPPMYSAKFHEGQRLYALARKGQMVERKYCSVHVKMALIKYDYPYLELSVECSKGTYIRSLAHDMGRYLGCLAHVCTLRRTRSGPFKIEEAVAFSSIEKPEDIETNLLKLK